MWTKSLIEDWNQLRTKHIDTFESVFNNHLQNSNFSKWHDVNHDASSLELFGSFLNIDEMDLEKSHIERKKQVKLTNPKEREKFILKRV